jgi:hypothetical protein
MEARGGRKVIFNKEILVSEAQRKNSLLFALIKSLFTGGTISEQDYKSLRKWFRLSRRAVAHEEEKGHSDSPSFDRPSNSEETQLAVAQI